MTNNRSPNMHETWLELLKPEFEKPYMKNLRKFLIQEKRKKKRVYPSSKKTFRALKLTGVDDVKVVILGQDPYHGYNQAHGLSFSVINGVKKPPSLVNIFKELKSDIGKEIPESGNLEHWAKQGVLLLNSILTVRKGQPGSHRDKGWELFTDSVIDSISVHKSRLRMGDFLGAKILKEYSHLNIDAVIPVPDTSRTSAMQVAYKLGVKYREGFIKNRYIGRTFIMPGQSIRKRSVAHKLSPIEIEFKNKNILLVDDSIVRGNTSKKIIEMVRKQGAKRVYFASAAPPVRHQNVYGIDMPATKELVAHGKTIEQVKLFIGADELIYQDIDDLRMAAHLGNPKIVRFEDSVFTGEYCAGKISEEYLSQLENNRPSQK